MAKVNKSKGNVPNLRFPEFEGEWESKKLTEILSIGSGRDYKHLSSGDVPVFGTGGLMTYVDECLFEGESVCIGRKGTINKPYYHNGKLWTVDTLFYTHSFKKALPKFIYYIFQNIDWLKYNEASGVPSLSKSTIEKVEVSIPGLDEQEKLKKLLSALDERIQTQNKIIEQLETLIQNLRNQIFEHTLKFKNNVVSDFLRWDVKKLGEIAYKINKKNKDLSIKVVFSNSAILGIVNQTDFFDKEIANQNNIDSYYIVEKNDFVYNPRISKEAPVGPISRNKIGTGVMSPLYMVLRFKEGSVDFFEHFFKSNVWHEYMESIANYGARADRMSFSNNDFFEMPLHLPTIEEQNKIANFLQRLEQKNEIQKQILERYEEQKQYLLQNLFI